MGVTFIQYLAESSSDRGTIKRVVTAINSATNNEFNAELSTKAGTMTPTLAITTTDGKIPAAVYEVFKQKRIGIGQKTSSKNEDGSVTIKFIVVEI